MHVQNQPFYSLLEHVLLSAYSGKWQERNVLVLTVYIDDSGTAPDQQVVIAAALIVPASKIIELDREWEAFKLSYKFQDLHASECVARNARSCFAGWNDAKVNRALARARRIMKRYAVKAFAYTIHKEDFEAEAPQEWLLVGGRDPFSWALRSVLNHIRRWIMEQPDVPVEYVFDWVQPKERAEIEMLMAQFESLYPGEYEGHYTFRMRKEVPCLQCADLLAWSNFSRSRLAFRQTPMNAMAATSFRDLNIGTWHDAFTHTRENLAEVIRLDRADLLGEERRRVWHANYIAAKQRK